MVILLPISVTIAIKLIFPELTTIAIVSSIVWLHSSHADRHIECDSVNFVDEKYALTIFSPWLRRDSDVTKTDLWK